MRINPGKNDIILDAFTPSNSIDWSQMYPFAHVLTNSFESISRASSFESNLISQITRYSNANGKLSSYGQTKRQNTRIYEQ